MNIRKSIAVATVLLAMFAVGAGKASAATISSTTPARFSDNFVDDGECSLREMVQIANLDDPTVENACTVTGPLGDDTIQLAAGFYGLTRGDDSSPDDNQQGDLDVLDTTGNDLAITGAGQTATTITTGVPGRVIEVLAGAGGLSLADLSVSDGLIVTTDGSDGGGILFDASSKLELQRVTMRNNTASLAGGAIRASDSNAVIELRNSLVDGNEATEGGGVASSGTLSVTEGSEFKDNSAGDLGGGINQIGGGLTISDSILDHNHNFGSTGWGGGVFLSSPLTDVAISNSRFIANEANGEGGGLYADHLSPATTLSVDDSLFQDNVISTTSPANNPAGGGLYSAGGTTDIDHSVIRSNEVNLRTTSGIVRGGGIEVSATNLHVTDSAIADNSATLVADTGGAFGAGISDLGTSVELRRTTVSGNTLFGPSDGPGIQGGAGIRARSGSLLLVNSTVSGNIAPKVSTSNGTPGSGAGIYLFEAGAPTAEIVNSTIAGNQAGDLGGTADPGDGITIGSGATASLRGSLVDSADSGESCDAAGGTLGSGGGNVVDDPDCFAAPTGTDLQGQDPMLAALSANGGPLIGAPGFLEPLQTQALLPGSLAIDHLPSCLDETLTSLATDERGVTRPQGGACDSGASELVPPATGGGGQSPAPGPSPTPGGPGAKKCLKKKEGLEKKLRRQHHKLDVVGTDARRPVIQRNIEDTRRRLRRLGC